MRVGQRQLADVMGHADRQLAAGIGRAGEHIHDGLGAELARDPCVQDGGTVLGSPRDGQRAARHEHEHGRRAGGDDRLEQLLLSPGQTQVERGHASRH